MSSSVTTTAIGAFVGCVVGSVVTAMMTSPSSEPVQAREVGPSAAVLEKMQTRMDALEDHNRSLLSAVVSLEGSIEGLQLETAGREPASGYATKEDLEILKSLIQGAKTPPTPDSGVGPRTSASPEVKEQVATALEELREEQRLQRYEKDLENTVLAFSDWLQFSGDQSDQFRSAWIRRAEREQELADAKEAGSLDPAGLDALAAQHEQAFLNDVSAFLSTEQYETIQLKFGDNGKGD